jgi:CheY-like chemotaxis protein
MNPGPILYAEDEENDAFFLQRAFRTVGILHPLVIVNDGQEVINYCLGEGDYANTKEQPPPCLIILDLNMPKKSGINVLDWVRKESPIPTIPVIVLTSSLQDSDIDLAYGHGANAYLVKPHKPDELIAMSQSIKDFWLTQNRTTAKRLPE